MKTQRFSVHEKFDLSLLSAGSTLFLFVIFLFAPNVRSGIQMKEDKKTLNETKAVPLDLCYIKPFTALARFGHKTVKETEVKTGNQKMISIDFSLLRLKPF